MSINDWTEDYPVLPEHNEPWPAEPVQVLEMSEEAAPEYASCMTWTVPQAGVGQPVQILTRRLRRHKAKMLINTAPTGPVVDTQVANPAAGTANFLVYTVPAGDIVTLQSLAFTYTTDATVGNRVITLVIRDGAGNTIFSEVVLSAQPASTVCTFNGFIGSTQTPGASGASFGPLPNILLSAGWVVRLLVTGTVGAADQFSATTITVNTLDTGVSVVLNSKLDPLQGSSPQGFAWSNTGPLPDWESQQPLYAIAVGGTATLSVWDESYAER